MKRDPPYGLARVARARHALEKGRALIVFDPESQQCLLMLKEQVPKELLLEE